MSMKPSLVLTQVLEDIEKSPHTMHTSSTADLSEIPEAEMRQNSGLPKKKNNNNLTLYGFRVMLSRNNV